MSYSELWRRVCGVGAALRAAGVGPADRVATVVASGPEAALALVGVASHAVCAPIDSAATAADVERACADLRVGLVVCDRALRSPAAEAACRAGVRTIDVSSLPGDDAAVAEMPGSGDDAFLLTTSGTTSRPKFARITHGNLCAAAANTRRHLQLTAEDRCLNVMPLSHGSGLSTGLIASLTAGASVVCAPRFDPALMIEWLEEVGPTWYAAVPAMHQALLSALARDPKPVRVPSLRLVRSSGMALPPAVLTGLERVFRAPVIEAYGMVGAGTIAGTSLPPGVRKPGSVGMPVGPEVAIIGEDDKELAPGQRGAIVVRGPTVTPGYVGEASAAEAAFTENGWFRTGDEGFLDGDGYLTICGRLKDVINRGGEKVSPVEVDEVLLEHPDDRRGGGVAVPHGTLGEEAPRQSS